MNPFIIFGIVVVIATAFLFISNRTINMKPVKATVEPETTNTKGPVETVSSRIEKAVEKDIQEVAEEKEAEQTP